MVEDVFRRAVGGLYADPPVPTIAEMERFTRYVELRKPSVRTIQFAKLLLLVNTCIALMTRAAAPREPATWRTARGKGETLQSRCACCRKWTAAAKDSCAKLSLCSDSCLEALQLGYACFRFMTGCSRCTSSYWCKCR